MRMRTLLVSLIAATASAAIAAPANAHPTVRSDAVSAWNETAGEAAVAACLAPTNNPLHESRMYAMTHLAIHDALNAINRRSRPYAYDAMVKRRTSPDAAVAAAARDVLVTLLEQLPEPFADCVDAEAVDVVEADYAEALGDIPDGPAKTRGIELGRAAAAAILALRAADGSDTTLFDSEYEQGTAPGVWRFTPGFDFAFAPGWGEVTPFVLRDSSQFHPGPPYALTRKKYTADFNEVKSLGGDGVTTPSARTAEQTEIALFWVESSPLQWNRIARAVAADTELDLWEQARLFGLLNMALADGYVGSFETKYQYDYWRPVTAIQTADTDGNPDTERRPELDAAGADTSDPGLRLGAQRRRWSGGQGPPAVLRHRSHRLRDLQPDAAVRKHVRRREAGPAPLRRLFASGGRERGLEDPRRLPLPQGGRGGDRARRQDRKPRGQRFLATHPLTAHHAARRGPARRASLVRRPRLSRASKPLRFSAPSWRRSRPLRRKLQPAQAANRPTVYRPVAVPPLNTGPSLVSSADQVRGPEPRRPR